MLSASLDDRFFRREWGSIFEFSAGGDLVARFGVGDKSGDGLLSGETNNVLASSSGGVSSVILIFSG